MEPTSRLVLAAIDDTAGAERVLATGRTFAEMLGVPARAMHVTAAPGALVDLPADLLDEDVLLVPGDPAAEIVAAADDPDVVLAVIGSRNRLDGPRPAGHVATAVVERSRKPVVVVPPSVSGSRPIRRVLVPLEGSTASSLTVADPLAELIRAGVEPIALHVFDERTVPRFWDDAAHARASYAHEFRTRWCRDPAISELRLRRGRPAATVLDFAEREPIDLIAIAWGQDLGPGRADLARTVLGEADVPVLLVPVGPGDARDR
jgi:nucleotide-binding universal stress UspA family protein